MEKISIVNVNHQGPTMRVDAVMYEDMSAPTSPFAGSRGNWPLCWQPYVRNGERYMAITEQDVQQAEKRMQALRENGFAVSARYNRRSGRVVINLNTGVQIAFPPRLAEGLANASPADLAEIEISPAGLGLHWPKLDADVYVPALLQGVFGSRRWMAAQLGATGGKARSRAKAAAARENGRKGGRPSRRRQSA